MKTDFSSFCLWGIFAISLLGIAVTVSGQPLSGFDARLDRFSRKCERRTKKAERRFERYERKMTGKSASNSPNDAISGEQSDSLHQEFSGLGKEPLLDSLRLVCDFADYMGGATQAGQSLARAERQLDVSQRAKNELMQRKEYWKAQVKEHPEYGKWLSKMEKERYYYTAQINEYRKMLCDPSVLNDQLLSALRRDPRWSDFLASLPAKQQDPAKMQPRQLALQMMQTQAAAIDPDATQLIRDAQQKGSDLTGSLRNQSTAIGNMDHAAQTPKFTPNPYKTKSFWNRIDVGFNLQFDGRTYFLPATGVAGAQASFNFDLKLSAGILANYRFGMGDIKKIRFSHAGAGYGAFAHYSVWKMIGVQAGFERNWRAETESPETVFPAKWTSSALAGVTWEYDVGKKVKGSAGVFYDFLHRYHQPETNAVVWRMGWKF